MRTHEADVENVEFTKQHITCRNM